jgi:hypothetical protein
MRKMLRRLTSKHLIGLAFFFIIVGYASYQMHGIASGPALKIEAPLPATTVHSPLVTVSGQAKRIAHIYLNNSQIFTDEEGNFKEKLLLAPGYNILKLAVTDKFGRYVEKKLEVVYN